MLHLAACEQSLLSHMPGTPSLTGFSKRTRVGTDPYHGESKIRPQPPCMWRQTSPLPEEIQAFSFALQNNLEQNTYRINPAYLQKIKARSFPP